MEQSEGWSFNNVFYAWSIRQIDHQQELFGWCDKHCLSWFNEKALQSFEKSEEAEKTSRKEELSQGSSKIWGFPHVFWEQEIRRSLAKGKIYW